MDRKYLKRLSPLLALAIFLLAVWTLRRTLAGYRVADFLEQIAALPPAGVAKAAAATACSYLVLFFYDYLGLRYIGRFLERRRILLASFTAYAFSRNVGFTLLTGGSVRFRFYSSWGLSAGEVARLIAFAAFGFTLGLATMAGLILLLADGSPAALPGVPDWILRSFGILALAGVAGYLALVFSRRAPFRFRGMRLPLPKPAQAIGQTLVGSADWLLTASVLYLLLPPSAALTLPGFLQIYLLAQLAVIVSHVPGGLGVFESVVLLLVPGLPPATLFGALLVYRGIYYLLPLLVAILLMAAFEARQRWFRRGV